MRIKVENGRKRSELELPMSDARIYYEMKKIGVNSAVPVCRLLDVPDKNSPLGRLIGQHVNIDEANFLAKRMESLTEYEKNVMYAYGEHNGVDSIKEMINLTYSLKGLSLITDFSDTVQMGKRLYMDESAAISEEEMQDRDFTEFASKVLAGCWKEVMPCGVFIEHGFEMEEVYNGRNFPEYVHNTDETVAVVEVANKNGDKEYLYLPTDICSVNKVKARLNIADYRECETIRVENLRLPESLVPKAADINDVEDLNLFNEMCKTVSGFDDGQMRQLAMAAEYAGVGAESFADITCIAKHLGEFEINPDVHSDAEYGEFIVKESGLFDVDELLLPYIDYAAFGQSKREGTLAESGYITDGFVGCLKPIEEYMQYNGEYADVLELYEDSCETLMLYSPLVGKIYENGDDIEETLYGDDLAYHEKEISDAIELDYCISEEARGLMQYFDGSLSVASKVLSAKPAVAMHGRELYGVLECKIEEPLTREELDELKEYWTGQMSDGWGEGFEQRPIKTDSGEIYVSFWSRDDSWRIMEENELEPAQGHDMGLNY